VICIFKQPELCLQTKTLLARYPRVSDASVS
jgi:hypothetical protein